MVRTFLSRLQILFRALMRELRIFILSGNAVIFGILLLFSFGFWYMRALNKRCEKTYNLRIHYLHLPIDSVALDDLPTSVRLTLTEQSNHIFQSAFSRHDSLVIDFNHFLRQDGAFLFPSDSLQLLIRHALRMSAEVVSVSPHLISVPAVRKSTKVIPVTFLHNIAPASGFAITDSISYTPHAISVYGDSLSLDTLSRLYSHVYVSVEANRPILDSVSIDFPSGLISATSHISFAVPIEQLIETQRTLPVEAINLPPNTRLVSFPSHVNLSYRTGRALYSQTLPLRAVIDYSHISANHSGKVTPSILLDGQSPEGSLFNIRISPSEVDYLLELQ